MNKITTRLEPLHGRGEEYGDMSRGRDDDDIVAKVQKHFKDVHAGIEISREQVLAMPRPDTSEG